MNDTATRYLRHRRLCIAYCADAKLAESEGRTEDMERAQRWAHRHEVECWNIIVCAVAPVAVFVGVIGVLCWVMP
jgi:hypothetical protein